MNDAYAASLLDLALEDAEIEVRNCQAEVNDKKLWLDLAQGHLDRASAKVEAIKLIISRSSLITSRYP